ncbi:HPF/RaiA family ribosome-associated protein [Aurantimonas sp. E1-2-R+4]|uniref:HPF/RaiA family ribosome-associated protein n=1 Tax=Aurantimonas sp. E1-2-R+4 TaxID=3113714 RepID=UPI002F92E961
MQFQLNTDANIQGDDRLAEVAETVVTSALGHLTDRLSRIEVHLVDVNGAKGGADDIRCTVEARPEGMQPQTVTHNDANVDAALRGAAKKIRSLLDSEFGKLGRH